jgi:MFS transporter, PAT family, solute carrier family 33 (acetyl-CoA transportor), member 1
MPPPLSDLVTPSSHHHNTEDILPLHNTTQRQAASRDHAAQGFELETIFPDEATHHRTPHHSQSRTRDQPLSDRQSSHPDPDLSSTHLLAEDSLVSDSDSLQDRPHSQMPRRKPSPSKNLAVDTSGSAEDHNGHASGVMSGNAEYRRKHTSLDSPNSTTQAAHLMAREDFTLDREAPITPGTPGFQKASGAGFWELPKQDRRNFLLLVLLYFLQGIPMGLATGSVPFILKKKDLSYSSIGVFSLASYPYSLKLLWSPIVDAVWTPKLGRRKSWILPIQMLSGFGMLWLSGQVDGMMVTAAAGDGSGVWAFTGWWFFLVAMCATQDIAVDGMDTTILYLPLKLPY